MAYKVAIFLTCLLFGEYLILSISILFVSIISPYIQSIQQSLLFTAYINAENIKCKHGVGGSNGNHDVDADFEPPYTKDCDEGITQCMKTGIKLGGEFIFY